MERKNILSKRKGWGFAGIILLFLLAGVWLIFDGFREREPRIEVRPDNTYEETIIVAADLDYQPYSFYSAKGEPQGYDVELIYLLADSMKKNVEIRLMQWVDAQAAVQSGEADVLMGMDYNVDALRQYELSMPLDNDPFVAFGYYDLANIGDFYNKRIATLKGGGSIAAFLKPYQLESQTQTYDSYGEAFRSVEQGENDYAIAMYSVGRRAIANLSGSKMRAVGPILSGNYLCIGTKKGNTALLEELNQAIVKLKREGTLDQLGEKWLGRYVEVISVRDFIKQNVTPLILLITAILLIGAYFYSTFNQHLAKSISVQHEMTKRMLVYQQFFTEVTKGLYESIYDVNVTSNCIEGETTRQYFKKLGLSIDTPFDDALKFIARTQIKEEFREKYVNTFSTKNILREYEKGNDCLTCEFLIRNETENYYWMRVTARIFSWKEDGTVRMITYRVNIDDEKRKVQHLVERIQEDALTGLYNKVTTGELVQSVLTCEPGSRMAFLMLDIDDFKSVNDCFGHAFGDLAIIEFANELKCSVKTIDGAIVGRVGGDEFAIFLPFESRELLEAWAAQFVCRLSRTISMDGKSIPVSASVGIALCPYDGTDFNILYRKADDALYQAKKNGKNGYMFYKD